MKQVQRILVLIAMLACVPALRAAAQTPAEQIDLWSVRQNLNTAVEVAEKGGDGYQRNIDLLIDQTLHLLRSPKSGGEGYFFAIADKENAESLLLQSTKVDAVLEAGQVQLVTAEVATPFELEITSPAQRSAFKNNGDTYIKAYRVELVIDGARKTVERKVEDWVRSGTTMTIPLPGIAQWASIEVDAAVNLSDVNHAIIKLLARVPQIQDDPRNPYSFSIDELKTAREYNRLEAKRGVVVEKLKSALKSLDAVPGAGAQSPPAMNSGQLVENLEYVLFLMNGTDEEKAQAKDKLTDIINKIKTE